MNAEQVFKFCRAYKMFYQGKFDFKNYGGRAAIFTPPLINQPERRHYYRISQKLNDDQIHALFTIGYFRNPRAYVTDLSTPEALTEALAFSARGENGRHVLESDLYELSKRLKDLDVDDWLYGEKIDGTRATVPGCVQDIEAGTLSPDVACLVLLIPQPDKGYQWFKYMTDRPDLLGDSARAQRLLYLDRLLKAHRTGWRGMTHELAKNFWAQFEQPLSPAPVNTPASLF